MIMPPSDQLWVDGAPYPDEDHTSTDSTCNDKCVGENRAEELRET